MGFFSWLTADTKEPVANVHSRHPNGKRTPYLLQPNGKPPIGGTPYEGYGEIGGVDAYEWLAQINGLGNDRMSGINIEHSSYYEDKNTGDLWEFHGVPEAFRRRIGKEIKKIGGGKGTYATPMDELGGKSANDMIQSGQWISHEIKNMAEYQIKISYNPKAVYEELPPSETDPNQGHFYSDEEIEDATKYPSETYNTVDDPDNPGQQIKVQRGFEDMIGDEETNESISDIRKLAGLNEMDPIGMPLMFPNADKEAQRMEPTKTDVKKMTSNELKNASEQGRDPKGNKLSGTDVMDAQKELDQRQQKLFTERPWRATTPFTGR